MPKLLTAALTALTLALAACGDSGPQLSTGAEAESSTAQATIPGGADPEQVAVIDSWATALSSGDLDAAAGFFAIPSIAENGPTLIRINDLNDARLFNASLPCAATLEEATDEGRYIVATFRLGEKPGSDACGQGVGGSARTAFVIEDGEIVEWRRVADEDAEPAPGSSA